MCKLDTDDAGIGQVHGYLGLPRGDMTQKHLWWQSMWDELLLFTNKVTSLSQVWSNRNIYIKSTDVLKTTTIQPHENKPRLDNCESDCKNLHCTSSTLKTLLEKSQAQYEGYLICTCSLSQYYRYYRPFFQLLTFWKVHHIPAIFLTVSRCSSIHQSRLVVFHCFEKETKEFIVFLFYSNKLLQL